MTASVPALADVSYEEKESVDDHIELLDTLSDLGVDIQINNPNICSKEKGTAGFWVGSHRLFVLCQQAIRRSPRPVWDGQIYRASDDDLDTIRHEAHHVIQDCMDGKIDGSLTEYLNPENRVKFLALYPDWKEQYILEQYREMGTNDHVISLEIEAWAVADMVPAHMINDVVKRECEGL